jgi:hypothetical protein
MTGKKLKFAALVRGSSERQIKQGSSLLTQTEEILEVVAYHDEEIYKWYRGQKHATPF